MNLLVAVRDYPMNRLDALHRMAYVPPAGSAAVAGKETHLG
jgi:hypothetical protein